MSNSPNPGSPAGKQPGSNPPPDDEFNLEEYDKRPAPRPKLPEQRREAPSFEIGGPSHGTREDQAAPSFGPERFESTPAPAQAGDGGWEPATPDEIANYDLGDSASTSARPPKQPTPAVSPPSPGEVPGEKKPAENLNDLEEFIARTATEPASAEKPPKERRPLSIVEKLCFGAGGALLLALLVWLGHAAVSVAGGGKAGSSRKPDLPMKGKLITLTEAASGWRKSVKNVDRVEQVEVILPAPGHYEAGIIPELAFTIDPASSAGFLRIIFRDSEGQASGDTRVVQVSGGKVDDPGQGGTVKSSTEAVVYCSSGLYDESAFRSYERTDVPRWSIEIAESSSYNSDNKDWKILGTFDVSNKFAP